MAIVSQPKSSPLLMSGSDGDPPSPDLSLDISSDDESDAEPTVFQRAVPVDSPPPAPAPGAPTPLTANPAAAAAASARRMSVNTPTAALSTAEIRASAQAAVAPSAQVAGFPVAGAPGPARPSSAPLPMPPAASVASSASPSFVPAPVRASAPPLAAGASSAMTVQPISLPAPSVPPLANGNRAGTSPAAPIAIRADTPRDVRPAGANVVRSRAYAFVLDSRGMPVELGSGRFAKAYLGEERWLESKTDFRRHVVIKLVQKGVNEEDRMRFQIEKELLERVQGHPNIITLYASGESDDPDFIPQSIRDKIDNDFVILERLDMSLEERLKGSRARGKREDLLACDMRERLFRALEYMIPVSSAVEYSHLVRNISHRDIKPANILLGLPDPNLRGSTLEVRLADFNVAKLSDEDVNFGMTRMKNVPGTLFFQSPEQETNVIELLVNVQQGSPEVEFFEDFYIQIEQNDNFSLYNRGDEYAILYADRDKKRIVLDRPYRDVSETNVRAKVQKSVGRPADIYSLGALFYYLISGAYANPKSLYDAFHKFIEYEHADENNTIEAYLAHEYSVINSLRAPKSEEQGVNVAPADRFFSYKHYLDGNGELIDPHVIKIIAKCMIRSKPDSYCQAHDIETTGISLLVQDLIDLYSIYGYNPSVGSTQLTRRGRVAARRGGRMRWIWTSFTSIFRRGR